MSQFSVRLILTPSQTRASERSSYPASGKPPAPQPPSPHRVITGSTTATHLRSCELCGSGNRIPPEFSFSCLSFAAAGHKATRFVTWTELRRGCGGRGWWGGGAFVEFDEVSPPRGKLRAALCQLNNQLKDEYHILCGDGVCFGGIIVVGFGFGSWASPCRIIVRGWRMETRLGRVERKGSTRVCMYGEGFAYIHTCTRRQGGGIEKLQERALADTHLRPSVSFSPFFSPRKLPPSTALLTPPSISFTQYTSNASALRQRGHRNMSAARHPDCSVRQIGPWPKRAETNVVAWT
ncbi:hypothetical protein HDK77DRAFT_274095 [Phyllosticta capitalensis]